MARPIKEGLDYFPLDVDIDTDDKIAMIEALHGIEGFGILIKLFMKIYKESYFYEWDKREQLLFSKRVNVDINTVNEVVNDCINEGIFNKYLYQAFCVLTSKGIQKRYLEAIKRRKEVVFRKELFLIDDVKPIVGNSSIAVLLIDANNNKVNVNNNAINDVISTQRKEKEIIKEKEKEIIITQKQNAFDYYQQNFGIIGSGIGQKMNHWIDEFQEGHEVLIYAMDLALEANVIRWDYCEKALTNWFNRGAKTLDQCKALQQEFKNKKGAKEHATNRKDDSELYAGIDFGF